MTNSERPHDEAMAEALRADPGYAAELRAVLEAEDATDELAILDRQLALRVPARPEGDPVPSAD
jgi:hypothetical protein